MALDATELIIIGVIAVVIFLWGPQKIPELARALGRAKKEFDTASHEVTQAVNTAAAPVDATRTKTADEVLIETARKLGIPTEGKTREQLSQEIVARASK